MKTFFTLFCCSFLFGMFALTTQAQTIPNNGFETWTNVNTAGSWKSNNTTYLYLRQSTDKHGGTYAAEISTLYAGSAGNLSGIITLGNVNVTTQVVTGGIPISVKPTDLHGYYKYTAGSGSDRTSINVTFTKWTGSSRITLANATFTSVLGQTVSTYTLFTIPITYSPTTIIPDTFNIICKSSQSTPIVGSKLLVDDLAFTVGTGIEVKLDYEPTVYPNPVNDRVFFSLDGKEYNINITNMVGQTVLSANTSEQSFSLETSQLPVGYYNVTIDSKTHHFTKKLLVSR